MAETALILVGALLFAACGLGVFTDDTDLYPRVRWFCGLLMLLGACLLAVGVYKVING